MTREAFLELLGPITRTLASLDLSEPAAAQRALQEAFPLHSLAPLAEATRAARDAGWLTPRQASETVAFGRVAKPGPQTHDHSIDAVQMRGAALPHTHPRGEVSLCFAESGDPRFCGHPEGWVVVPPGSHHTPEVTGGEMLILYFLPQGAMEWGPQT